MMLSNPVMHFSTIIINHCSISGINIIGVRIDLMHLEVKRFSPDLRSDFFRLHSEENGCGWCFCTAWWVPTWDGWSERTTEQNREFRENLLESGEYDGYILYENEHPIGWCQAGPHNRLKKLVKQFSLDERDDVWAITCFLISPQFRNRGMAYTLLEGVLKNIKTRGAKKVLAFPKVGQGLDELSLWNGPLSMYIRAGFFVSQDDPHRPVLMMNLKNNSE
jgi:GNAT superfamily N-acetyltransferase